MQAATQSAARPKRLLWTGYILSAIAVLFMLLDGVGHLLKPAPVVQAFAQLEFPLRLSLWLGVIQFACTLLYIVPRTAILGAVLLTGYLGGAIAIHLRVGNPVFECTFPVFIGIA